MVLPGLGSITLKCNILLLLLLFFSFYYYYYYIWQKCNILLLLLVFFLSITITITSTWSVYFFILGLYTKTCVRKLVCEIEIMYWNVKEYSVIWKHCLILFLTHSYFITTNEINESDLRNGKNFYYNSFSYITITITHDFENTITITITITITSKMYSLLLQLPLHILLPQAYSITPGLTLGLLLIRIFITASMPSKRTQVLRKKTLHAEQKNRVRADGISEQARQRLDKQREYFRNTKG